MSWATKRKLIYGGGVFALAIFLSIFLFYKYFYIPPTCSNHTQDGDETGIDCGGSCQAVCTSDALTPVVLWSKIFNISGSVYNLAAYVENPNLSSQNPEAHYIFNVYDDAHNLLVAKSGVTFVPASKKFVVFESGIIIPNKIPKRVEFEFTSFGAWQKVSKAEPSIAIHYSGLESTSTRPNINGTVTNNSLADISKLELTSLVSDSAKNVIAVSRTFVDNIAEGGSQPFIFTWPKPFSLGVEACTNPVDVALVLDRSGSMRSEGNNPPEPFTTVKETAKSFIKNLSDSDGIAVFSFGTTVKTESPLGSSTSATLFSIDKLTLATTSEQTNIGDGLQASADELIRNTINNHKVIVMLTDGVPTEPTQKGHTNYAKDYATRINQNIKSEGITIYTIGLGKGVDSAYLKSLATDDAHFLLAPEKSTLTSIYKNIATSLCEKKPSTIQVLYRLPVYNTVQ